MRSQFAGAWWVMGGALALLLGCGSSDNDVVPSGSSGKVAGGGGMGQVVTTDTGFSLRSFEPPADPGKGGILFTVSGEELSTSGYPFPPKSPDDAQFYDGWDVTFTRLLVTVDQITLSSNPDKVPGDSSQTGGIVAKVEGPWAVDLHHDDPSYLAGKSGGGERAIPFAALTKPSDGDAFLTDGTRYAFGFSTVAAIASAHNVNLDAAALDDYQEMISKGCAVMYVGVAKFAGKEACNADAEYANWPKEVNFRLCFKSPTSYLNCQNPDNTGEPLADDESQRGVAFETNDKIVAQLTFHTDHPFWDSTLHDSPAHFDQFAARAVGHDGGTPTVTLEDTVGLDYTAVDDALARPLRWRYCSEPGTDAHPKFTGVMAFDPGAVPHAPGADAKAGLRDYYDFATYNQSTQGHLNADGLCFVKRNYDSPD